MTAKKRIYIVVSIFNGLYEGFAAFGTKENALKYLQQQRLEQKTDIESGILDLQLDEAFLED